MKTTKNCCPCCGSKDITIDVDITVGTRFENGMLILDEKNFDTLRDAIDEAIEAAGYDQMKGFCYGCGSDFSVDHIDDTGVYFSGQLPATKVAGLWATYIGFPQFA